jgi:hypothetical protein
MALHARYELTGDIAALREAISVGWQTLEIVPQGHAQYVAGPYRLVEYLQQLYGKTREPVALDDAVKISRWGLQISYGDPHYGDHLRQLANLLREVYADRHDLDALREAIHLLRTAAAHLPQETRNAVMILMSLGAALGALGGATEDADIFRDGVQSLRAARAACGTDTILAASVDHNLAMTLGGLYKQTGQVEVLAQAVQVSRQALGETPGTDAARGERAGQLGAFLTDLATESGGDTSLEDEAIGLLREAVRTTHGLALQNCRYGLWKALRNRYNRGGGLPGLEEAIEQLRTLLADTDPRDDAYSEFQHSLGTSLLSRYQQTTDAQTLTEAVQVLRAAAAAVPAEDRDRYWLRRASLAIALVRLFQTDRDAAVLDEGIGMLKEVITAGGDAPNPVDLSNLVDALLVKFGHTGQLACLEEAIDAGRRADAIAPDEPTILSNLANALNELFDRTGQRAAADEALSMLRRAAATVPPAHPSAAAVYSNISVTMTGLAERLGRPEFADEALDFARRAAAAAPPGHQGRAGALSNLGTRLTDRFYRGGQEADLREAVAVLTEAARIADRANRDARSFVLHNLALATDALGEQSGDEALRREAVQLARQALAEAASPAQQARMSAELGRRLYWLMVTMGDGSLLEEVLSAYGAAAAAADAAPWLRLQVARARAEILADARRWPEALEDYVTAIGLISEVAARHLPAADKQHQLASLTALGVNAAACALNAGQPQRAIELAEHARGVLLAEAFDTRADLTELRACAPGLAARLISLRDQLNAVDMPMSPPAMTARVGREGGTIVLASPAEHQHRLGQQWNDLLSDIRGIQGFETFLLPLPMGTLTAAATEGPVALLNVSRFRCDALVLRHRDDGNTDLQVIRLPGVDASEVTRHAEFMLSQSRRDFGASGPGTPQGTVPDILEWLWDTVIEPVLAGQGLLSDYPPIPLPRIWWCPTGFLSCLPLHAAARRDAGPENRTSALDHVISSYTPTISALARQFVVRQDHDNPVSAVVVAMQATPGGGELPAVATEAQLVADTCRGALVLEGPQARYEAVVAAVNNHSLAHFACHAVTDEDDPAASHLVLHDHETKPLTVADIIRCPTDDAELAFLSACSTGQTSPGLLDEALHITSAFHIAGFPQVIGTLWPADDTTAAEIVRDFYASYLPDGTDRPTASAAYALHEAIQRAARRYRKYPLRWASHVHVGR